MIARSVPLAAFADLLGVPVALDLWDQEAIAVENRVSKRTVRRRCEPVACDVASRAPLYDPDAAAQVLSRVKPRPARSSAEQMLRRLRVA